MHTLTRLAALGAALLLAGCSSADDELYEIFACAKVATLLEREDHAQRAMAKAEPYLRELEGSGSPARLAMEMGARFQEDVPLYRYSPNQQMQLLAQVHQSSECQAAYAAP